MNCLHLTVFNWGMHLDKAASINCFRKFNEENKEV